MRRNIQIKFCWVIKWNVLCFDLLLLKLLIALPGQKNFFRKRHNMKTIVLAMISCPILSCTTERDIQADIVDATLIKVEMVKRYPNAQEKWLTWSTSKAVNYVTVEPANSNAEIGMVRKVMIRK
jgi:hypothetical protein